MKQNIFKTLRKAKGITQCELSKMLFLDQSTVSKWESETATPDYTTLQKLADYFNVSTDYLLGRETPVKSSVIKFDFSNYSNLRPIKTHKIPLLGKIACGIPSFATEDRESYVECGTDIKADFCLQAQGDSMIGARILDGDIVFIREQSMVENGEIAAVIIDDVATLKRVYYYENEGKLFLQAENPKYAPLVYIGEELNNIKILGKAISFQSDVR